MLRPSVAVVVLLCAAAPGAAAQPAATLCDDSSSLACSLYEYYIQAPTKEEIQAALKEKRAALKRQAQSRIFGVRVGWDRAWHALKDVSGMAAGAVATVRGGTLAKPALLLQAAALSSSTVALAGQGEPALTVLGEAKRDGLAALLAVALVHL
eukprot:3988160-Prymnesium_polylepis.1